MLVALPRPAWACHRARFAPAEEAQVYHDSRLSDRAPMVLSASCRAHPDSDVPFASARDAPVKRVAVMWRPQAARLRCGAVVLEAMETEEARTSDAEHEMYQAIALSTGVRGPGRRPTRH